jgi:hypothetical protein
MLFFSLATSVYSSSLFYMQENKLFGIEADTIKNESMEKIVLNSMDSINSLETVEPYNQFPIINCRYKFANLPHLKVYCLEDGTSNTGTNSEPYSYVLFDSLTNSIYPFDGLAQRFSMVISNQLPLIMSQNQLLDLIRLYLCTIHTRDKIYIFDSIGVFRQIWDNDRESGFYKCYFQNESDIDFQVNEVSRIIRPPSINNRGKYYEISLYTWHRLDGGPIEYWDFRISDKVFEVSFRNTKMIGAGPFKKLGGP